MKKYHFIYLLFLCLIATSCENTFLEEEIPATQVTTRNSITPEEFARNNSLFYNIESTHGGMGGADGISKMTGDVNTFEEGVEYDFILYCKIRGDVKCVLWAGGNVVFTYNGRTCYTIYGESGKYLKFTAKFYSSITTFRLALETGYTPNVYKDAYARFVFNGAKYNGEWTTVSPGFIAGGSHDLVVEARYWDSYPSSSERHWTCSNCGFTNTINDSSCKGCRK